jgi:hypothetical protein
MQSRHRLITKQCIAFAITRSRFDYQLSSHYCTRRLRSTSSRKGACASRNGPGGRHAAQRGNAARSAPMPSYTINITIDAAGLQTIATDNLAVTLAQPVNGYVGITLARSALETGDGPAIAWLAFKPFSFNQVVTGSGYFLYMTATSIAKAGTVLKANAITSATVEMDAIYAYQNGYFSGPTSLSGPGGAYSAQNLASSTQSLNFGLAQSATINGASQQSVLNAMTMSRNMQASFYPQPSLLIFLSSCTSNGTIIPFWPSNALPLTLATTEATFNVMFNDTTNTFYLMT